MIGGVYLLKSSKQEYYKIGKTNNFKRRIKEFGTNSRHLGNEDEEFEFVRTIECDASSGLEKELHKYFKSKRCVGEWFDITIEEFDDYLKTIDIDKYQTREPKTKNKDVFCFRSIEPKEETKYAEIYGIEYTDFLLPEILRQSQVVQRFLGGSLAYFYIIFRLKMTCGFSMSGTTWDDTIPSISKGSGLTEEKVLDNVNILLENRILDMVTVVNEFPYVTVDGTPMETFNFYYNFEIEKFIDDRNAFKKYVEDTSNEVSYLGLC